jgi:hypothetical protein
MRAATARCGRERARLHFFQQIRRFLCKFLRGLHVARACTGRSRRFLGRLPRLTLSQIYARVRGFPGEHPFTRQRRFVLLDLQAHHGFLPGGHVPVSDVRDDELKRRQRAGIRIELRLDTEFHAYLVAVTAIDHLSIYGADRVQQPVCRDIGL